MGLIEWSMVLCLSILWGMSFFLVELLIDELLPLTIVLLRVGIAATTLWAIVRILGLPFPRRIGTWTAFLVMGLLNNVIPFTLIVVGQIHIASGLAAILNATTPIFTMLVAGALLTDERLTAAKLSGAVLGLSGVAIIIGPEALQGIGENLLSQLAILGAALSYAFAFVFGRRFKKQGLHPVTTAAGQVSGSTMLLIPVVFYFQEPGALIQLSLTGWGAVAMLGVFSTGAAYVLFFGILGRAGTTNAAIVTLLIPVWAILLGSLLLGEILHARHMAGMALIALGLAAIDGRPLHWLTKASARTK